MDDFLDFVIPFGDAIEDGGLTMGLLLSLPMIAIGATAGAVFGSWVSEELVRSEEFVKKSLLLAALVPLLASILLTRWADRRGPLGEGFVAAKAPKSKT